MRILDSDFNEQPALLKQLQTIPSHDREVVLKQVVAQEVKKALELSNDAPMEEQQTFNSMGMNQLAALKLKDSLQDLTAKVFPDKILFNFLNIEKLTDFLMVELALNDSISIGSRENLSENTATPIFFPRDYSEWFPLRCEQAIFWLCRRINSLNAINLAHCIDQKLDIKLLKKALNYTMNRHPMCKVQFGIFRMQQRYVDKVKNNIECIKLAPGVDELAILQEYQIKQFIKNPIKLNKAPLLKVTLLSSADGNRNYIILCAAHIISDFHSLVILYKTLMRAYKSYLQHDESSLTLPEYNVYYDHLISETICLNNHATELVKFWEQYTKNATRFELPLSIMNFKRSYQYDNMITQHWDSELVSKLKATCSQHNISLTLLFVALSGLLSACYANTDKSYIYSAASGRKDKLLEHVVGYLYVLKLWGVPINPNATLSDHLSNFLDETKTTSQYQYAPAVIKGWSHYKNMYPINKKIKFFSSHIIRWIKNLFHGNIAKIQIENAINYYIQYTIFSFKILAARIMGRLFKHPLNLKIPLALFINMLYGPGHEKNISERTVLYHNDKGVLPLVNRNHLYIYLLLDGHGGLYASINGILAEDAKKKVLDDLAYIVECLVNKPDTKASAILEKIHGWD